MMKRIVCIGDSNTYGYDPRSYLSDRYEKNVRWTGRLEEAGYEVINLGMNGACIPQDGTRVLSVLQQNEPYDCGVVMLGSNDLLEGCTAKEAGQRMYRFLEDLPKKILLVSPVPFQAGEWVSSAAQIEESNLLAYEYRRISSLLQIRFADAADWNVTVSYDGVHYLPEGHAAFAKGIAAELESIWENHPF